MNNEQKAAVLIAIQAGYHVFLHGNPGQGKSSFVRQGFGGLGYTVEVKRVQNCLPHRLVGSEVPDLETGTMKTLAPEWAIRLSKAEKAVLLLDDFSSASPLQQQAALCLTDEQEFGETKMNVPVILAGNPDTLATARFAIDAASANRCLHIFVKDDPETFRADVLAGFPAPQVPKLRENWRNNIPDKAEFYTRYLASPEAVEQLNSMPEEMTTETMAWPSQRSWEMCWILAAAVDGLVPNSVNGLDIAEVKKFLFWGAVGKAAHEQMVDSFSNFIDGDPEEVLKEGKHYAFPERGDQLHALMMATLQLVQSGMDERRWKQAWSVLEGLYETAHRDRVIPFAVELCSLQRTGFKLPGFYKSKLKTFLEEAA